MITIEMVMEAKKKLEKNDRINRNYTYDDAEKDVKRYLKSYIPDLDKFKCDA